MAISLQKGQRIDLKKGGAENGSTLTNFCVGVNWGGIKVKTLFGLSTTTQSVDLDLSCVMLDEKNNPCDHLYSPLFKPDILQKFGLPPGKTVSNNGALRHSGDDVKGDSGVDDGLDNEVITVDLSKLDASVKQIYFFLNNVGKEDFSLIPYAKIRMYEGTASKVKEVFATFNVASDPTFVGKKAMIMGKLYKKDNEWKFNAIGDPTDDVFLAQTIHRILKEYV